MVVLTLVMVTVDAPCGRGPCVVRGGLLVTATVKEAVPVEREPGVRPADDRCGACCWAMLRAMAVVAADAVTRVSDAAFLSPFFWRPLSAASRGALFLASFASFAGLGSSRPQSVRSTFLRSLPVWR